MPGYQRGIRVREIEPVQRVPGIGSGSRDDRSVGPAKAGAITTGLGCWRKPSAIWPRQLWPRQLVPGAIGPGSALAAARLLGRRWRIWLAPLRDWDSIFKQLAKRPRSRGSMCPRFASISPTFWRRGRRESRVTIAPMGPVQKSTGVGPQVNRKQPGFPCAVVYDLLRAPRWPGFVATVASRNDSAKLSASIGAPGPHDFAVRDQLRSSSQAVTSTASHRAFVTCATPLSSGETRGVVALICPTG